MEIEVFQSDQDGAGLRIGIVQARFNESLCNQLRDACLTELVALGVQADDIFVCSVPGALEIPLVLQQLAESDAFDALVAIGSVVRGETYHFEIVSNESAAGVSRVALENDIPIANAILTTDTETQAQARVAEKGADAARVAVEMANLSLSLAGLAPDLDDEFGDFDDDEFYDEDDEEEDDEDDEDEDDEEEEQPPRKKSGKGGAASASSADGSAGGRGKGDAAKPGGSGASKAGSGASSSGSAAGDSAPGKSRRTPGGRKAH